MRSHQFTQTHPRPKAKRVGRGNAAGGGTTAGRGTKGQKARTGSNSNLPRTFIGGSTSLVQRLPKFKGFKSHQVKPVTLNVDKLTQHFAADTKITLVGLLEKGIISTKEALQGVKIVGGTKPTSFSFETDNPKLVVTKKLLASQK